MSETIVELLDFLNKNGFEVVSLTLRLKHAECPKTIVALMSGNDVKDANGDKHE